jgi:hypothetical protein
MSAAALVQSKAALSNTITLDSSSSVGNLLVIVVGWKSTFYYLDVSGVADNLATPYTECALSGVSSLGPTAPSMAIFYGVVSTPGIATITATMPAGATNPSISVSEFSGVVGTEQIASTTWAFPSVDETANTGNTQNIGDLQFVGMVGVNDACVFTVTGGTLIGQLNGGGAIGAFYFAPSTTGGSYPVLGCSVSVGNKVGIYLLFTASAGLTVSPFAVSATVNTVFTFTVSVAGGTPPYVFSISAGALPPGLTLDPATGIISGTVA